MDLYSNLYANNIELTLLYVSIRKEKQLMGKVLDVIRRGGANRVQ